MLVGRQIRSCERIAYKHFWQAGISFTGFGRFFDVFAFFIGGKETSYGDYGS
jgi:hypothetical protein